MFACYLEAICSKELQGSLFNLNLNLLDHVGAYCFDERMHIHVLFEGYE